MSEQEGDPNYKGLYREYKKEFSEAEEAKGHEEKAQRGELVQAMSVDSVDSQPEGPSYFKYKKNIEQGDVAVVYVNNEQSIEIKAELGKTCSMKYGALRHEFVIGKPWGSRVSATSGYVHVVRPSAELWTKCMERSTQILYTPDISNILMLLDAKPGSIICESGTGSGSLSHALAMAIAPNGHLYTHDINEERVQKVKGDFELHGLADVTTPVLKNVCTEGFFVNNACDGVFLDVPNPWEAIPHAARAMSRSRGGRLVSFSPCIEQVQQAVQAMKKCGFVCIETEEIVPRTYKLVREVRQTLEEFDESSDKKDAEGNDWNIGGKGGRKRRFEKSTDNNSPSAASSTDNSRTASSMSGSIATTTSEQSEEAKPVLEREVAVKTVKGTSKKLDAMSVCSEATGISMPVSISNYHGSARSPPDTARTREEFLRSLTPETPDTPLTPDTESLTGNRWFGEDFESTASLPSAVDTKTPASNVVIWPPTQPTHTGYLTHAYYLARPEKPTKE